MQELVIKINNECLMIMPSLVRFRYSLISVLGVRMRQNIAQGLRSVSVIASRETSSLVHSLVPKRDGSHVSRQWRR